MFPQTSVALGVQAVLLEDWILCPGPKSVRGNWPLLPPVASRSQLLASLLASEAKTCAQKLASPCLPLPSSASRCLPPCCLPLPPVVPRGPPCYLDVSLCL